MSVDVRIRARWAQTEVELLAHDEVGTDYALARTIAIEDAIADVFRGAAIIPDQQEIDTSDRLIQQEIADRAVLKLMPLAKDVIMRGLLQESHDSPNQADGTTKRYNKIAVLDNMATQIGNDMAGRAGALASLLAQLGASTVPPLNFMIAAGPRR